MDAPSYSRSSDVVFVVSDGRAVLMHTSGSEMITLNPVGTEVWTQLAAPLRTEELGHTLAQTHPNVARTTIDTDIQAFLDEMLEAGLVERNAAG